MAERATYDREQLADAVATSTSWRGVLRALGLTGTSSSAIGSVRRRAEREALDVSHLARRRAPRDTELSEAVTSARTCSQVADELDLARGSERRLRAHAHRLALDTSHLGDERSRPSSDAPATRPVLANLHHAAPLMAAAPLRMRGHHVSWPLEPARYDLLVDLDGRLVRVQVRTTTHRREGRWTVWLSSTSPARTIYSTDEVDAFYVIDGDLTHYWIPLERVAGFQAVALTAYSDCILAADPT